LLSYCDLFIGGFIHGYDDYQFQHGCYRKGVINQFGVMVAPEFGFAYLCSSFLLLYIQWCDKGELSIWTHTSHFFGRYGRGSPKGKSMPSPPPTPVLRAGFTAAAADPPEGFGAPLNKATPFATPAGELTQGYQGYLEENTLPTPLLAPEQ